MIKFIEEIMYKKNIKTYEELTKKQKDYLNTIPNFKNKEDRSYIISMGGKPGHVTISQKDDLEYIEFACGSKMLVV